MMHWVKLNKYCELSGDTRDAVHAKRRRGIWRDEQHCRIGPDGNLWVNTEEVEKWITGSENQENSKYNQHRKNNNQDNIKIESMRLV